MGAKSRDHAIEGSGHVDPLAFHLNFEGIASFGLAVVGQPSLFGEHLVPHDIPPLALQALQNDRQHFFGGSGIDLDAAVILFDPRGSPRTDGAPRITLIGIGVVEDHRAVFTDHPVGHFTTPVGVVLRTLAVFDGVRLAPGDDPDQDGKKRDTHRARWYARNHCDPTSRWTSAGVARR